MAQGFARLKPWLGLALAAVLLYLLWRQVDIARLQTAAQQLSILALLLALACLLVDYALRTLRWQQMLRRLGSPASFMQTIGPLYAGFALNNILPLRAGDIVRAVAFKERFKLPTSKIIGSLLLERLFDLLALCISFAACLPLLDSAQRQHPLLLAMLPVVMGLASLALLLLFLPGLLQKILALFINTLVWREQWRDKILNFATQLLDAIASFRSPALFARLLLLSLLVWIAEAGLFFSILRHMSDTNSAASTLLSMSFGNLATMLPGTPGHLGTFDYFSAQGLQITGLEPSFAILATLVIHVVLWLPITLLGLLFLAFNWRGDFSSHLSDVRNTAQ